MSGEEFGLWLQMLEVEPMGPAQLMPMVAELRAALSNGPLSHPEKRLWQPSDFWSADRWAPPAPPPPPPSPRDFVAGLRSKRGF